jgi:acyl-CoA synthetase (NDP forming)
MGDQVLDRIFNPRGVAVVGASNSVIKFGNIFLRGLIEAGADVYPVNLREKVILGLDAYPSVKDIPHRVDYAIISIPPEGLLQVIEDCGEKGVKGASIYTAGYRETGTEEGKKREEALAEMAKKADVRIIGPNCLGICAPAGKLIFLPGISMEEGDVGFISQSGGHAEEFAYEAESWGLRPSKIISYGNGCDVSCEEFLDYLAGDPETNIIGIYIEGVEDGKIFLNALKEATKRKPVVVWKGGVTERGGKAAASHTGSLAGSSRVWEAAIKQSGAISVRDRDELLDLISAIKYLIRPKGRRVAIVGAGGGASVASTDICEMSGLEVSTLEDKTMRELSKIIPPMGTSVKNPVDISYFLIFDFALLKECAEVVARDENVDMIVAHVSHFDVMAKYIPFAVEDIFKTLIDTKEIADGSEKPLAVVFQPEGSPDIEEEKLKLRRRLVDEGMCVFPSIYRAARALANLVEGIKLR